MTIASTTSKLLYNGDGSTTVFAISFIFWDSADLKVVHRAADGTETDWTEGTHYTVTGGSGSTGSLTVETTPTDYTPAAGEKLLIKSAIGETQDAALPLGGAFPSTTVEQMADILTRLVQQHSEEIARSILLPETASLSGLRLPEPGAGELVRWNAAGTDLETVAIGDISTAINTVLTGLADLDFLRWDSGQAKWVNRNASQALTDLGATAFIKTLLDDADANTALSTLGAGAFGKTLFALASAIYPAGNGAAITNLAYANLTGVPTDPFSGQLLHVRDEKSSGTDGGSASNSTWHTRDLNTERTNEIAGAGMCFEIDYDAQTGNFTPGNTLTGGTSGATATIVADNDAGATGTLTVIGISGTFVDNETITDGGGGSATSNIPSGVQDANQFYLPAGDYYIDGGAVMSDTGDSQCRLRNITAGSTVLTGPNSSSDLGGDAEFVAIRGRFTLASAAILEIQTWSSQTVATVGLGDAIGLGETEVFGDTLIWKV